VTEARRAQRARYNMSAKGRAATARYKASPKGRAQRARYDARYNVSAAGRAAYARYNVSAKGKARDLARQDRGRVWRQAANAAVRAAVRCGELVRSGACSACGAAGRTEFHHPSYLRKDWLAAEELCRRCHRRWHRANAAIMPEGLG